MSSNPFESRRLQLAAAAPIAFLMVLAAIWLLYDAPFVREGEWAAGIVLLAIALLLPAVALLLHDLTGRRQAELALRQNEERLRQVIRASHIGIFDHDHVSGEIYWSPKTRKIFGVAPDEPVSFAGLMREGPGSWTHIHPDDRERGPRR